MESTTVVNVIWSRCWLIGLLVLMLSIVNGDSINSNSNSNSNSRRNSVCYQQSQATTACHSKIDDDLRNVVYERLFSKLESVQMDLRIIQSELNCPPPSTSSSNAHIKLFNETMTSLAIVSNTNFESVLSQVNCSLDAPCVHCAGLSPCSQDCSRILSMCLGATGLKFIHQVWKELIDNLRTSLRILLSQYPCTLQDISLLSKLHNSRDLTPYLNCGSTSSSSSSSTSSCFNISPPKTLPSKTLTSSSSPPPILHIQYETIGLNLRQHWPTTTVSVQFPPVALDELIEDGSGSGDGGGDGGRLKDLTDDEDLLGGGSEFGSGHHGSSSDDHDNDDSSSSQSSTPRNHNINNNEINSSSSSCIHCSIITILWLLLFFSC